MGKKTKSARKTIAERRFTIPSPQDVIDAMTPAGAWTAFQLAKWGVPWPPPKGWRLELEERWKENGRQSGLTDRLVRPKRRRHHQYAAPVIAMPKLVAEELPADRRILYEGALRTIKQGA